MKKFFCYWCSCFSLLAIALLFSSCVDMRGKFTALDNLEFKKHVRINTSSRISVERGTYDAQIGLDGKLIKLKLTGIRKPIYFKMPKNLFDINTSVSGTQTFSVSTKESNQLYDLEGRILTTNQDSPQVSAKESCIYDTYQVFDHTENDYDCNGMIIGSHPVYRTEYIYGMQNVIYHNHTTTHYYTIKFLEEIKKVGELNATTQNVSKVYDYQGPCEK